MYASTRIFELKVPSISDSNQYSKTLLLFDELLMSTKIYLRENDVVRPVNIKTKNIAYKTRLNDKLIQYTFEFENSYNKINII